MFWAVLITLCRNFLSWPMQELCRFVMFPVRMLSIAPLALACRHLQFFLWKYKHVWPFFAKAGKCYINDKFSVMMTSRKLKLSTCSTSALVIQTGLFFSTPFFLNKPDAFQFSFTYKYIRLDPSCCLLINITVKYHKTISICQAFVCLKKVYTLFCTVQAQLLNQGIEMLIFILWEPEE